MSDENDSIITVEQSPEELAAEEAAFASAFTETRGETEPEATPVVEERDEPVVSAVAAEDGAAPVATDTPPVVAQPVADVPKLIGGLTEDQLVAAINRNATLQGTVDKMAGRIGNLMQQIESLRANPPTTQAAQQASFSGALAAGDCEQAGRQGKGRVHGSVC